MLLPRRPRRVRRRLTAAALGVLRGFALIRNFLAPAFISLALSAALWVVITTEQNPLVDRNITVPVDLVNAPTARLVPFNSPAGSVTVQLNAPQDIAQRVNLGTISARVDLSLAQAGQQSYPVTIQRNDPRVEVVSVTPEQILVNLVAVVQKQVPVDVEVTGNLPPGFVVSGAARPSPAAVTVSGPEPVVRNVDRVLVRNVRLDGASVTINRQSEEVQPVNSLGVAIRDESLTVEPRAVAVTVPIDQSIAFRTVPVNATITGTVPTGYWLSGINVSPAAVTINGAATAIEGVNYVETAPINVTGLTARTTRPAEVVLPAGIGLTANQAVTVTIDVGVLQGSQTLPIAVQFQNLAPGLTAVSNPVRVSVAGPVPRLVQLSPSEFRAVVDMAGIDLGEASQGSFTREVRVTVPAGLQLVDVVPRFTQVYVQHQ